MKSSQSKFSTKKSNSGMKSDQKSSMSSSGCCCGSKYSEEVEEIEISDEEK